MVKEGDDKIEAEVERLYRSHFGRLVGSMLSKYRDLPLEVVEDMVQDSFAAALETWSRDGVPERPAAWIYVVVRNRVVNQLRAEKKLWIAEVEDTDDNLQIDWDKDKGKIVDDDQLRLLFACAHPELSPKVQVAVTLKYVVNLKVRAIAAVLGTNEDSIEKLLFRARGKLREKKMFMGEPGCGQLGLRLPVVHKIIYLIFNEGYKPAAGDALLKEELCGEALILAKALVDNRLGNKATQALYALMLFNAARLKARLGPDGALLDLEEQDRSLWSKPLILMACEWLTRAREGIDAGGSGRSGGGAEARGGSVRGSGAGAGSGELSSYHVEATIAWVHCTAVDFASTDWGLVSRLYERLMEWGANPWVELSYAIALYYSGGKGRDSGEKGRAFGILERLLRMPIMYQYYPLNVTMGKLYALEGDRYRSEVYYRRALELTVLPGEVDFIRRQLGRLRTG
ncbi:MAG TPA: sigma-70 family RNA polymerase sigma factor [Puia sp.]|nr:sigma-70 family RNA polymerase sigma factor [Puia sp.]